MQWNSNQMPKWFLLESWWTDSKKFMWNFILPRKSKTSEKEVERLALPEIKSYYEATLIRQQSFGRQIDKLTNGPK